MGQPKGGTPSTEVSSFQVLVNNWLQLWQILWNSYLLNHEKRKGDTMPRMCSWLELLIMTGALLRKLLWCFPAKNSCPTLVHTEGLSLTATWYLWEACAFLNRKRRRVDWEVGRKRWVREGLGGEEGRGNKLGYKILKKKKIKKYFFN